MHEGGHPAALLEAAEDRVAVRCVDERRELGGVAGHLHRGAEQVVESGDVVGDHAGSAGHGVEQPVGQEPVGPHVVPVVVEHDAGRGVHRAEVGVRHELAPQHARGQELLPAGAVDRQRQAGGHRVLDHRADACRGSCRRTAPPGPCRRPRGRGGTAPGRWPASAGRCACPSARTSASTRTRWPPARGRRRWPPARTASPGGRSPRRG